MVYRTQEQTLSAPRPLVTRLRRRAAREARAVGVGVRRRVTRHPSFTLSGQTYRYFSHRYRDTSGSERSVELPVALPMLAGGGRVLEVGDVLSHYGPAPSHLVVDKYDARPGVLNEDIVSFTGGPFDVIVSVSTVEHIGWDESPRDLGKAVRAIEHMGTLLAPGGEMLITIPVGYNRFLDDAVVERTLAPSRAAWLVRTGVRRWREGTAAEALDTVYGWPHAGANAVAFLWWNRS
jgi:SAM-dependent methyltransferase